MSPDDLQPAPVPEPEDGADDLAVAIDAALRAARVMSLVDDPAADLDHLL